MTKEASVLRLAMTGGTPLRAIKTALVVGTLLTLINQADAVLAGGSLIWWKAALTFCVPYFVATWGAVGAKREALRRLAAIK